MRKSNILGLFLGTCLLLFALSLANAGFRNHVSTGALTRKVELVRSLALTDLCLFTEASYTRHPSQTDYHAPFQDYPCAFDYFPSGSLALPVRWPFRFVGPSGSLALPVR